MVGQLTQPFLEGHFSPAHLGGEGNGKKYDRVEVVERYFDILR